MRSLFLSLVLGVSALGLFAMPATADAHPVRARTTYVHQAYGNHPHWTRSRSRARAVHHDRRGGRHDLQPRGFHHRHG